MTKSKCCRETLFSVGGETQYWLCSKCRKASDPATETVINTVHTCKCGFETEDSTEYSLHHTICAKGLRVEFEAFDERFESLEENPKIGAKNYLKWIKTCACTQCPRDCPICECNEEKTLDSPNMTYEGMIGKDQTDWFPKEEKQGWEEGWDKEFGGTQTDEVNERQKAFIRRVEKEAEERIRKKIQSLQSPDPFSECI